MSTFLWVFKEELKLHCRNGNNLLQPLFFFMLLASLFPLSIPADQQQSLSLLAPAIIWITAILSLLLGVDNIFKADYIDGTLEQYLLADQSMLLVIIAKIIAHWLLSGVLISGLAPVVAYAMSMTALQTLALFVSLLVGTLTVSLFAAFGSALTLAAKQSGVLVALLVLPLYIPVLIFGAGLVADASSWQAMASPFYMLLAILVLAFTLIPIAINTIFKQVLY